jgi:hypothetical protein
VDALRAQGVGFVEIGRRLGVSTGTAHRVASQATEGTPATCRATPAA